MRRKTRQVMVGPVALGGGAPIPVQSMGRAQWDDVAGALDEIKRAATAGCTIMRLAVPSVNAAVPFAKVAARSDIPLVADTHFDCRTTLAAIDAGAAKVRINPGNMNPDDLRRVVDKAGERGIPIRIGGNSGSILHRRAAKGDAPEKNVDLPAILAEESLAWAGRMEAMGFQNIVISVKTHEAATTVLANRRLAERSDYPLHLGVTHAGDYEDALLKSAAAMGSLLLDGIGDTLRFSFTGELEREVEAGIRLLRSIGLRRDAVEIVSCPACGRCRVDLAELTRKVKERLLGLRAPLRVAVMGCEVNGPGEAKAADVGIASAGGIIHLFVRGEVVEKLRAEDAVERLAQEAEKMAEAISPVKT